MKIMFVLMLFISGIDHFSFGYTLFSFASLLDFKMVYYNYSIAYTVTYYFYQQIINLQCSLTAAECVYFVCQFLSLFICLHACLSVSVLDCMFFCRFVRVLFIQVTHTAIQVLFLSPSLMTSVLKLC